MFINNQKTPFILLIVLLLYCFIAIFITPTWGDEKKFHYPNAQNVSINSIIESSSSYSSAYSPFPYMLGSIVLKVNDSIYSLRLLNYSILLILIYMLFKIAKNLSNKPILLLLILISNPYLLRSSFTYNMFNYGLLLSTVGIYIYYFSEIKNKYFWAHFFWGFAVLSQQWFLVIIAAIFTQDIIVFNKNKLKLKYLIKSFAYKFICLLPSLLIFYYWKGLTHPNFQAHSLFPSFEHLNGLLANWGLAAFFILVFNYKYFIKLKYLPILYIIPLIYLSIPAHSTEQGVNVLTGIAPQLAMQIQRYSLIPYKLNMLVLVLLGYFSVILILLKNTSNFEMFLKYTLLGFLIAFTASSRLGSSHIYVSIPFFFMIFYKEFNKDRILELCVLTLFYLMSLFYVLYFSLFVVVGNKL